MDKIVLISTHIIEDIELCSNKIVFIKNGIVSFEGTVTEAINKASGNIYSLELPINELVSIRDKLHIIEEKRINENMIKLKFIDNENFKNSFIENEVSLENAYVYFQEKL